MFTKSKFSAGPITQRVEIVRHTYDCFEVTAYDLFGHVIGHRMFAQGSNPARRRQWAIAQAEQWAEKHYLYFDGQIYS